MNKNTKQKIISAIENKRLKLEGGKRNWYNYILDIHELVWARNLRNGYNIYVYDTEENHVATVKI